MLFRSIGASHAFDPHAEHIADEIRGITTDKLGVTAVIDSVGIDDTLSLAASLVVPRGRITLIGLMGNHYPSATAAPNKRCS